MKREEVLRLLAEKSLKDLKDRGFSIVWEDGETLSVLRGGVVFKRERLENFDFYSMQDLISSIYREIFGDVVLTKEGSKEEQRIKGSKIASFDVFSSTADSDFYSDIKPGEFEKTICSDERVRVSVIKI